MHTGGFYFTIGQYLGFDIKEQVASSGEDFRQYLLGTCMAGHSNSLQLTFPEKRDEEG